MPKSDLSRHFPKVAAALPLAAIALATMQAQWNQAQGQRWNFPMRAYDPRDILRGKYLNVRLDYELDPTRCDSGECCACYRDVAFDQSPPMVNLVPCQEAKESCKTWLTQDALSSSYRYFVPEDKSRELEDLVIEAVREDRASVEFVLDQRRRPQIVSLLVDGHPI